MNYACLVYYGCSVSLISHPLPFPVHHSIEQVMLYRMMDGLGLWSDADQIVFIGEEVDMADNHSHHRGSCLCQAQASTPSSPPAVYCPSTYLPTIKAHVVYCALATMQQSVLCVVLCASP